MSSNDLSHPKTVIHAKDFPVLQNHYVGGKYRYFSGWNFSLRHYCVLGTMFAIVMAFLSTLYLESSLQLVLDRISSPNPSVLVRRIAIGRTVFGGTAFDSSLEISGEIETRTSPNRSTSVQEEFLSEDDSDHKKSEPLALECQGAHLFPDNDTQDHIGHLQRTNCKPILSEESCLGPELNTTDNAHGRSIPETTLRLQTPAVISKSGQCDITVGTWVPDPAGPLYRFDQCRLLGEAQNCQRNGRPDDGYQSYRWQPHQCTIPRFDPHVFLEMMRGKTLAFIGDSLARNQMESLMCILLQASEARSKGNRHMHRWYFSPYKFTIVRLWSSWLVQTGGTFPPSFAPDWSNKLNLTEIDDKYAGYLPNFDVTILSSGHWWLRKTAFFMDGELIGGNGWPWKVENGEKLGLDKVFEIAMDTVLRKVGTYPGYEGLTILRTYTPDHYTGGSWATGGSCTGETHPYRDAPWNSFNEMMHDQQMKAFKHNTESGDIMPNGSKLKLLDVYPILNYRGDGHPGPYRNTNSTKRTTRDAKGRPPPQDCLHWCMPGPLDTMNELLFEMLKDEFEMPQAVVQ